MINNHIKFIISPFFASVGCIYSLPALSAPGVPADPLVVWHEDFQNLPVPTPTSDVTDLLVYTGLNPANQAYTADPPWTMSSNMCNGILAAYHQNPDSTVGIAACARVRGNWNSSQQLSQALGVLRGQDINAASRNNYAVTAFTAGNPGPNLIMFRTLSNVPLVASNRFLVTSIDTAALNCQAAHPLLRFSFVDQNGVETDISPSAVDVCTNGSVVPFSARGGNPAGNAIAGVFNSPAAFKFTGRSVGYIIRNAQGSGTGNDFAFDYPKILDATPQLDKGFDPPLVELGHSSSIVFTITNTKDLLAKDGWVFKDSLSAGLTVSGVPTTTCPIASTSISAPLGADSISVTSSLPSGMASCTITVPVIATAAGIYLNNQDNISEYEFINPPLPDTTNRLEVTPSADMQADSSLPTQVSAGQTVAGTIACLNAGPGAAESATCGISGLPAGATTSCTPTVPTAIPLAASSTISCSVSFVAPAAGSIAATITAGSATPDPLPANNAVSYNAVITPAADMQASASLPNTVVEGQTVTGTIACLNAGPSAAESATCDISGLPAGATTRCTPSVPTATPLAASSAISCNVSFVAPAAGSIAAAVTAGSVTPDPLPANNAVSYHAVIAPAADMQASASLPTDVSAGQTVTGTIACLNAGPSAAESATCGISGLPAGATTSCTPTVPTATPLAASSAISCNVSYVAPAMGSIAATISAGSTTADPLPANNAVSYHAVIAPAADMQASASLPTDVTAGQTVTGTIACLNAGSSAAESATCGIFGLPAGATTSCTPTVPTATPLAVSSAISCNVSFVAPAAGSIAATITAGSATLDPLPANNAVSYHAMIVPAAADMQASASLPTDVSAGQTVTGTIACLNAGPSAAESATCEISGLPAGATTSCTPTVPTATPLAVSSAISCNVSFVAPTTGSIAATITAGSATPDPESENNSIPYVASVNKTPVITSVPTLNKWMIATLSLIFGVIILLGFKQK